MTPMRILSMLAVLLLGALPAVAAEVGTGTLAQPERQAMSDTLQYSLENNPTDQASDWVNPDTGRAGTVVPTRTFTGSAGQPCREFVTTITIGGQNQQGYGTACRQSDGSWQLVSDQRPPGPAPAPPSQTLDTPPDRYYAYPSGFYGPYSIYLSFSTVYRSGHFFRGRVFLDGPVFWARYPRVFRYRRHAPHWSDYRYHRYWNGDRRHNRGRKLHERRFDGDRNREGDRRR